MLLHVNTNPYEWGLGGSYQLYTRQSMGVQVNLDAQFPEGYGQYDEAGEGVRGLGIRLNPEFRYYARRKARNNMTSFFMGIGPLVKTMRMQESEWRRQWAEFVSAPYSQLQITEYRNLSIGAMGRIGIEGYIGRAQRVVFEASYGFGLTKNRVRINGDEPSWGRSNGLFWIEDISVSNRRSGLYPYIDVRFGIGYRLFGTQSPHD